VTQVVVIGGGIAGVSCAYHLARSGMRDVVLVEKGELTSGSTHHAAGLVTQFNPSPTMMRFRRYSVELYTSSVSSRPSAACASRRAPRAISSYGAASAAHTGSG
jgi:Glycine/D-amino acid oxidases (deaminating)